MENKVPELFENIVNSFYGCTAGNIRSPIWFCGLEWGQGYDKSEPILIETFEPYDFEHLHTWTFDQFVNNFWAPRSSFCRNVLKALLTLQRGQYDSKAYDQGWSELAKQHIVGPDGLALILNLLPISMSSRALASKSWNSYKVRLSNGQNKYLKEWTQINSFEEYQDYVVQQRSGIFNQTVKKYKPKLIVCFGTKTVNQFQKLFGASSVVLNEIETIETQSKINVYYGYMNKSLPKMEQTLLFVTPFPANSNGLNSDDKINSVFSFIYKKCLEHFGENWLGSYGPTQPLALEASSEMTNLIKRFDKLNDLTDLIRKYKEGVSRQLTYIETIETSYNENLSLKTTTLTTKQELLQQLHRFDDSLKRLNEERKSVEALMWELDNKERQALK